MMSDQAVMTEILGKMMKISDPKCLETIANAAWDRKKDNRRHIAEITTASWRVGDDVQLKPEHRSRKPYGAVGKIVKINKVKMKVDFGNNQIWNIPKNMLMLAE